MRHPRLCPGQGKAQSVCCAIDDRGRERQRAAAGGCGVLLAGGLKREGVACGIGEGEGERQRAIAQFRGIKPRHRQRACAIEGAAAGQRSATG